MDPSPGTRTQLDIGPFTACIVVEGRELPLYGVESMTQNVQQSSCWIASEVGKRFAVKWRTSDRSLTLATTIKVDGYNWGGGIYKAKSTPNPHPMVWRVRDSCRTSQTTKRPYTFAQIQTTDEETYLDQAVSEDLGTIVLRLDEVKITGRKDTSFSRKRLATIDKVHERKSKAMNHHMKLGDTFSCEPKSQVKLTKAIRTLATFVFKYRSQDFLQAQGIIPRKVNSGMLPNPPPHNLGLQNMEVVDLSVDEPDLGATSYIQDQQQPVRMTEGGNQADAAYQRIQNLTAELEKAKREYRQAHDSGNVKRETKEEGSSTGLAIKREAPIENLGIIDLTDMD